MLHELGYERLSFADPLRKGVSWFWGIEAVDDRAKLVGLGEAMRALDEEVFVNLLQGTLKVHRFDPLIASSPSRLKSPVVVDDLRRPNEYRALKGDGFVVVRVEAAHWKRIDRLKASGKWQGHEQLEHETETALDTFHFDHTIDNNGTTDELYEQLVDVLIKARKR